MRRRVRQRVIVKGSFSAGGQKTRERVGKPERPKYVDGGLSAMRVGFRVEHGNSRRESVVAPHLHDVSD